MAEITPENDQLLKRANPLETEETAGQQDSKADRETSEQGSSFESDDYFRKAAENREQAEPQTGAGMETAEVTGQAPAGESLYDNEPSAEAQAAIADLQNTIVNTEVTPDTASDLVEELKELNKDNRLNGLLKRSQETK